MLTFISLVIFLAGFSWLASALPMR